MPFEVANKIEEVARDPEKVAPQSGAYPVATTRRDRCNLRHVFSQEILPYESPFLSFFFGVATPILLIELNLIARSIARPITRFQ